MLSHLKRHVVLAHVLMLSLAACSLTSDSKIDTTTGCDGQQYPPRSTTPYVLPYPVGKQYIMNLGNCSVSFHSASTPDRYAYDFGMDVGTLVTAVRAGRVAKIVENGTDGVTFINNLVVVDHGDGSFASYMHLTKDGAIVGVGEAVTRGDSIGYSGNTGLAGYPHLHLIVTQHGYSWPYEPVPMSFSNSDPTHLVLQEGKAYGATAY